MPPLRSPKNLQSELLPGKLKRNTTLQTPFGYHALFFADSGPTSQVPVFSASGPKLLDVKTAPNVHATLFQNELKKREFETSSAAAPLFNGPHGPRPVGSRTVPSFDHGSMHLLQDRDLHVSVSNARMPGSPGVIRRFRSPKRTPSSTTRKLSIA